MSRMQETVPVNERRHLLAIRELHSQQHDRLLAVTLNTALVSHLGGGYPPAGQDQDCESEPPHSRFSQVHTNRHLSFCQE